MVRKMSLMTKLTLLLFVTGQCHMTDLVGIYIIHTEEGGAWYFGVYLSIPIYPLCPTGVIQSNIVPAPMLHENESKILEHSGLLTAFQTDLGSISSEILALQQQSVEMNLRSVHSKTNLLKLFLIFYFFNMAFTPFSCSITVSVFSMLKNMFAIIFPFFSFFLVLDLVTFFW